MLPQRRPMRLQISQRIMHALHDAFEKPPRSRLSANSMATSLKSNVNCARTSYRGYNNSTCCGISEMLL